MSSGQRKKKKGQSSKKNNVSNRKGGSNKKKFSSSKSNRSSSSKQSLVANQDTEGETNIPGSSSAQLGSELHSIAYDENENTISSINNNTASVVEMKNNSGASQTMLEQQREEPADGINAVKMEPTAKVDLETVRVKQRLRILEHQVKNLRNQNAALQQARNDGIDEAEKMSLKYSKQIDVLTQQLEQVVERNVDVLAEKEELEIRAERAEERIQVLEANAGSLRALVTEYLSTPTEESKRSFHEKEFWDKVATPRLMAESMPPSSYDSKSSLNDNIKKLKRGDMGYDVIRAHPVHTQELEATVAQLKSTTAENVRLRRQLDKLQHENSDMRLKRKTSMKDGRELIARQQRWLMGTVRRMKWVVSQKKQLEKELKSRSLYVGKLETKLLKQTSQIRGLKNELRRHKSKVRRKGNLREKNRSNVGIKGGGAKKPISSPATSVVRDVRRTRSSDLVGSIVSSPRRNSIAIEDQIDSILSTNASDKNAGLVPAISGVLNDKSTISSVDDLDEIMRRELSVNEIEEIEDTTSRKLQSQFVSMYEDNEEEKSK